MKLLIVGIVFISIAIICGGVAIVLDDEQLQKPFGDLMIYCAIVLGLVGFSAAAAEAISQV